MPIAAVKPKMRVRVASMSRANLRRTRATPRAAMAPNSGPKTIAPITKICESSTMAMPAINVASVRKSVGPVEFAFFVGALRDFGPHNRVRAAPGSSQFGVEPAT